MKTLLFSKKIQLAIVFSFMFLTQTVAATITSTTIGGRWDAPSTWVGGSVPTSTDDVIIAVGSSVIIRSPYSVTTPAICNSLTVNGTLIMGSGLDTGSKALDVVTFIIINAGGVLTNDGIDVHRINVAGDFTNLGTFTFSLNTGSIQLTFNGVVDQTIGGSSTQNFGTVIINKTTGKVLTAVDITTVNASSFTLTAGEFAAPENLNISGAMILTSGTFTSGTNTTLSGNLTNNGAVFQSGTGTVNFNGTSQIVAGTTSVTFNHVNTSGSTNTVIKNTTVLNGNLFIGDGTSLTIEKGVTVNGTTTIGNGVSGTFVVATATGTKTFSGHFTISQGATWDNAIGDNAHFISGVTNYGTVLSGNATYYFDANAQSIFGTISFPKVLISTGVVLTNYGNLTISTSLSGGGSLEQGSNSVLTVGVATVSTALVASAVNNTVNYNGAAQTVKSIDYVNLILSGTDVKTLRTGTINITGDFTISGTASATTVVDLVIGGNLKVGDGATFSVAFGITVNGTTTIGDGTSGVINITSGSGTKTFVGLFKVSAGATWNNSANDNAHFNGGLTNEGNFLGGTGTYYFEVNSQTITGAISTARVHVLTGVTLTNNGNLSISETLYGPGTFVQGNNSSVSLGGTVIVVGFVPSGANNTVNYNGGVQTIRNVSYINLGLSGSDVSHIKTWPVGLTSIPGNLIITGTTSSTTIANLSVGGNLSIGANASLTNGNSYTLTVAGTLSGLGKMIQSTGSVLNVNGSSSLALMDGVASNNVVNYNASSPHVIPGTYFNLMLNQSDGEAVLDGNVTVGGNITLNTGNVDLEDNHLTIGATATISITSPSETKMIVISGDGELRKEITSTGSIIFPIGEASGVAEYSPVTINVTSASGFSSAYIGVRVVDAKHFSNNSNTDFLTRYWTVSQSGISNCVIDFSGSYSASDVDGSENLIVAAQLNGVFNQKTNGWNKLSAIGSNAFSTTSSSISNGQTTFTGISNSNPTVTITGGNVAICRGTTASLNASTSGEGTLIYSWSPSTGLSATNIVNPTAGPTSTTTYTLTIYDGNGASVSDNTVITVQGPITQVNNLIFCEGESGQLTASGADTYEWTPVSGLSTTSGATVTASPTTTTVYTVKGTETSTSCFSTAEATVTVKPLPVKPTITPSDIRTETPKLTSSSATGNQWYKDGVIIAGATNQVLTVTTDGSYTVQVTTNGCQGPVSNPYNIVIVGITENNFGTTQLFPNPAVDVIQFDRSNFLPGIEIEIKLFDLMGRLQVSKVIVDSENSLDIRNLAKGPHVFVASQNNKIVIQKFIKN